MKNTFKLFGIIAIIALALTACFSLWKGDEAVITLYLGGGAGGRAAMKYPPDNGIRGSLVHIVQLSGPDGDQTIEFEKGALTAEITVVPGRWVITVKAFLDDKLSDMYAEGSRSVNLIAGRNNKVEIEMQYARAEVPGDSLTEKLNWLGKYAQNNRSYVLEVGVDENIAPHGLSYGGRNVTITLKGIGANGAKTVSLLSKGSMFYVDSGVTLILDNITLNGFDQNTDPLISIGSGGTLTMEKGSVIKDNIREEGFGGGVWMDKDGNLTMNGNAEISGNTAAGAGGVCIHGNLTMNNTAKISGNNANGVVGGGVFVGGNGILTMNGNAEISGNAANKDGTEGGSGGGVYISGPEPDYNESGEFNMYGGVISGNTAEEWGGGIFVQGTFRIVTGIIYGSDALDDLKNTAYTTEGAALAVHDSGGTAQYGTFVSGTWTKRGALDHTIDKTIDVYDGEKKQ